MYGGGMGELGVARGQIQLLAVALLPRRPERHRAAGLQRARPGGRAAGQPAGAGPGARRLPPPARTPARHLGRSVHSAPLTQFRSASRHVQRPSVSLGRPVCHPVRRAIGCGDETGERGTRRDRARARGTGGRRRHRTPPRGRAGRRLPGRQRRPPRLQRRAAGAAARWRLGPFAVRLTADGLTRRGRRPHACGPPPRGGFVAAGAGDPGITDGGGGFYRIRASFTDCWRRQSVTAATHAAARAADPARRTGPAGRPRPAADLHRPRCRPRARAGCASPSASAARPPPARSSSRAPRRRASPSTASAPRPAGTSRATWSRSSRASRASAAATRSSPQAQNALTPPQGADEASTYAVVPQYLTSRDRGLFLTDTRLQRLRPAPAARDPDPAVVARAARADPARRLARRAHPLLHGVRRPHAPDARLGRPRRDRRHPGRHGRRPPAGRRPAGRGRPARGRVAAGLGRPARHRLRVAACCGTGRSTRQRYAGWEQMVADFRAQGIRVMTYINPMLADAAGIPGPRAQPLRRGARRAGTSSATPTAALPRRPGRLHRRRSSTSPRAAARAWTRGVLRDMAVKFGASGWMADFAEQTPFDGRFANGAAGRDASTTASPTAGRTSRPSALRSLPDVVDFHRAAFTTQPALGAAVLDGRPDGELERARRHALGAHRDALRRHVGLLAQPLRHRRLHDARRAARAAQRGAPGPLVGDERLRRRDVPHARGQPPAAQRPALLEPGGRPARSPAGRGSSARWPPIASGSSARRARTGMPIVRPLWFSDAALGDVTHAFTLGRDVLVAPAFAPGAARTTLPLPRRPLGARLELARLRGRPHGHRRLAARRAGRLRPRGVAAGRDDPPRGGSRDRLRAALTLEDPSTFCRRPEGRIPAGRRL